MPNQAEHLQEIECCRNRVAVLRELLMEAEQRLALRAEIYEINLAKGRYREEDATNGETDSEN